MTILALLIAAASLLGDAPAGDEVCKDLVSQTPPAIKVSKADLFNHEKDLDLDGLRGRVVWIEFSFYYCAGCKVFAKTLVKWHKDYEKQGLVILYVDNGRFDTREQVAKLVKEAKYPFPVVWDKDAKICQDYGVVGYPAAYLVGRDGKVRWNGLPGPTMAEDLEARVKAALAEKAEESSSPDAPTEAAGDDGGALDTSGDDANSDKPAASGAPSEPRDRADSDRNETTPPSSASGD